MVDESALDFRIGPDLHRPDSKGVSRIDAVWDGQELFGIPYVTAPMEAEAQCATLEELGLVDGVITDDSDVFLFGAKRCISFSICLCQGGRCRDLRHYWCGRVFKNIFEQTKFVESYRSSDVETELHLDRKKLIFIAHLLGSDYAAGVHGIGETAECTL